MQETQKGKDWEIEFAKLLEKNNIEFKREISISDANMQVDFNVGEYGIEISLDNDISNIQRLCFRAAKINENGMMAMLIVPLKDITKHSVKLIFKEFNYVFDSDFESVIDFLKRSMEITSLYNEDIWDKMLNDVYLKYLNGLGEKHPMLKQAINSKAQEIMENNQNTPLPLDNPHEMTKALMKESESENNAEYLTLVLNDIFHKIDLAEKAQRLIEIIKDKGSIEAKSNIYTELGSSFSQYYDTILKKLKREGIIRKEGRSYILDSKYSLDKIKQASYWIRYADITKNQPKELARVILSLFGIDVKIE